MLQQVGKGKEPRYQGLNYPGTRALLIDWHLRRCRVAQSECEGVVAIVTTGEREA